MPRRSSPLEHPLSIIATPATKYNREFAIAVKVSSDSSKIPRLPVEGDTYASSKLSQVRMSEFKNHVCTEISGQGDYIYVTFSPSISAANAGKPFKPPKSKFGNLFWHPTLLKVDVVRMSVPRAVNIGNRIVRGYQYQAIPTYHPSMDTGTAFVLTQYLCNEEPDIPQHPTPQVTPINFPVPGAESGFSFPECYHPKIDIEMMRDVVDVYETEGGQVTSTVGNKGPFSFAATDPPFPTPYVLYERPAKLSTGQHLVDHMLVIPPNLPAIVTG